MSENILITLVKRMQSESPVLFKWIMRIAMILLLPMAITYGLIYFGVWVPEKADGIKNMLLASGGILVGVIGTSSVTTNDLSSWTIRQLVMLWTM
jgi:hypothetical protein